MNSRFFAIWVAAFLCRMCSSSIAATLPSAAIPDIKPHTYCLLSDRKGATVVAVTMSFGFYRPGVTTGYLSRFIDLSNPDEARRSPEGLQCLSEKYLLQKDMKSLSRLYLPDQQEKESHSKANDEEPTNIVETLRVQARFGVYTYLGVSLSPMPELPTGIMLVQTPVGFAIDDDTKGLPLHIFNLLAQDYDDYGSPQSHAVKLDGHYTTVHFASPKTDGPGPPPNGIGNHQDAGPDSDISIAVRFTKITAGPYKDFFDRFYKTIKSADDDGVRKLFTADSQKRLDNKLQTVNGRQEFEADRRFFQSGIPTDVLLVDGDIEKFLIFKVTTGDPSTRNTSAVTRLFIYSCLEEHGNVRISLDAGDTTESLLVKYYNVPSDLCRQLVDVFDSERHASSQPLEFN